MVNPGKGWLASTNNFVTSKNIGEHAISHAFSFEMRAIRIGEMIEEMKAKNHKMVPQDMMDMAVDTLDI